MWVDIHPGLCSIAMFATFNSVMPNTNLVCFSKSLPGREAGSLSALLVGNKSETVLCPAAR